MASPTPAPVHVTVYTTPPEALVELLSVPHDTDSDDPPRSLPLIRRLRFTRLPGGITEHSRILFASAQSLEERRTGRETRKENDNVKDKERESEGDDGVPFAAAYLDFSRAPETELWIYSSMEEEQQQQQQQQQRGEKVKKGNGSEGEKRREMETACAVALLREVKRQRDMHYCLTAGTPTTENPTTTTREEQQQEEHHKTVLIGNLNEVLRTRLVAPDVGLKIVSTGLYDKWFFRVDELPDVYLPEVLFVPAKPNRGAGLRSTSSGSAGEEGNVAEDEDEDEEGKRWSWDIVRREDLLLTISRTNIPRQERTMKLLPSTAIYLDDGTPVAWAFLGPDSSLSSLHCEEPYRGKGIAKAVAVKALRDNLKLYVDDGQPAYGWADVAPDNLQSRGVCKSLKGEVKWQISWSRIDLELSFPDS